MASALAGVKRPADGPALIPTGQPGFRGVKLGPADAIKTPRLSDGSGNNNNRTSNIQVVYSRVVTEDSVTLAAGRLGPGDVCFMRKKKARFQAHAAGTGLQQVCVMLGLDGANRLLCGELYGSGMTVGVHVLDLDDPETPTPAAVLPTETHNSFKLDAVDELTLDGVIVSNESHSTFNATDVCFNVALSGSTNLQNSLSFYTQDGSELKRTSHLNLAQSAQAGYGEDHYVGKLTSAPHQSAQMFDRSPQLLTTCCIGLQARHLTTKQKMNLKNRDGTLYYQGATKAERLQKCTAACACHFSFTPFTSRQAWALQPEALHTPPGGRPVTKPIDAPYDAIRLDDLKEMVGFWTVGKIVDTAAARNGMRARAGPTNASSLLRVHVDISFRHGLDQYDTVAAAKLQADVAALPDSKADDAERRRRDEVRARLGRQVRANLLRPSGRTILGRAFGERALETTRNAFCLAGARFSKQIVAAVNEAAAYTRQVAADAEQKADALEAAFSKAPAGAAREAAAAEVVAAQAEEVVARQVASGVGRIRQDVLQTLDPYGAPPPVFPYAQSEWSTDSENADALMAERVREMLMRVLRPPPAVVRMNSEWSVATDTENAGKDIGKRVREIVQQNALTQRSSGSDETNTESESESDSAEDEQARKEYAQEQAINVMRMFQGLSESTRDSSSSSSSSRPSVYYDAQGKDDRGDVDMGDGGPRVSDEACEKEYPGVDKEMLAQLERDARKVRDTLKGWKGFDEVVEQGGPVLDAMSTEVAQLVETELKKNFDGGITAIEEVRDMLVRLDVTDDTVDLLPQAERDGEGPLFGRITQRAKNQAANALGRSKAEGLAPAVKKQRALELRTSEAFVKYLKEMDSAETPTTTDAARDAYNDAVNDELGTYTDGITALLGTNKGVAFADFFFNRSQDVIERLQYLLKQLEMQDAWWKKVAYAKLIARNEIRVHTFAQLAIVSAFSCARVAEAVAKVGTGAYDARTFHATRIRLHGIKTTMRIARLQSIGYARYGTNASLAKRHAPVSKAGSVRTAACTTSGAATASAPTVEAAVAAAAAANRGKSPARKRPVAPNTGAHVTPGAPVRKRPIVGSASSGVVTASVFENVLGPNPNSNSSGARRAPPPPPDS